MLVKKQTANVMLPESCIRTKTLRIETKAAKQRVLGCIAFFKSILIDITEDNHSPFNLLSVTLSNSFKRFRDEGYVTMPRLTYDGISFDSQT